MGTNTSDFLVLLMKSDGAVSWGRGWGVYNEVCPLCGHFYTMVAPIGAIGFECQCGYTENIHWCGNEPCDGIWLDPVAIPNESIITPN